MTAPERDTSVPLQGLVERITGDRGLITAASELDALIPAARGGAVRVQTVNLHHVYLACTDERSAAAMDTADYLTLDGKPLVLLAQRHVPGAGRVTGREFVERLAAGKTPARSVAVVGATELAAADFAALLAAHGVSFALHVGGSAADWDLVTIAADLNRLAPDVVLVAVTPPRGELVAAALRTHLSAGLVVQVGGAVDMVTGRRRPPPDWIASAGLEWLWRFALEPRRLFVRYFWASPVGLLGFVRALRGAQAR